MGEGTIPAAKRRQDGLAESSPSCRAFGLEAWLRNEGFTVLRFWNGEVLDLPELVRHRLKQR